LRRIYEADRNRLPRAPVARICLCDFLRGDDVQVLAVPGGAFRPVVAAHDGDPAIDNQGLFVRHPGAGIDPYRDAGGGDSVKPFLQIARRPPIGDKADIDPAAMGADQRGGDTRPLGQHIGIDQDFMLRGIDRADGETGTVLFRREDS